MYPLLGGNAAGTKFNAKNPLDTNAANRLTFNGGWSYSSSGATPNGANGYANTYISGNTIGTRYSQHMCYYVNKGTTTSNMLEMGALYQPSGNPDVYTDFYADLIAFGGNYRGGNINSSGSLGGDSPSHTAMTGNFITSRTTDTTNYMTKNGSQIFSSTTTTTGSNIRELFVGARNENGGGIVYYSDRGVGFISFGSGLTPAEMTTYSSIINTWATSIGRNTY